MGCEFLRKSSFSKLWTIQKQTRDLSVAIWILAEGSGHKTDVLKVIFFIKYHYSSWCGQVCQPSVSSPQVTQATIRDDGTSCASTCLRRLPQIWQRNCTVYIKQQQHQFGRLSFAYVDWSVSKNLIFHWYLGLEGTRCRLCPTCWWEEVLSLQGASALSDVLSGNNREHWYKPPTQRSTLSFTALGRTEYNSARLAYR